MSGIYVHIPFCHRKCHYCDFYSVANKSRQTNFHSYLINEIEAMASYLTDTVKTVYFGGGTPSVLATGQLKTILEAIQRTHPIANDAEITIEVNPEDMSQEYLAGIKELGFNRISIGVQSFNNSTLLFLGRKHSAQEAAAGVANARSAGFTNISVDLIYGIPNQSLEEWTDSINTAISLNPEHLSCYHLTIEPGTLFGLWERKQRLKPIPDENSQKYYDILCHKLREAGYNHYEISNFAKKGFESKHNSSYWNNDSYLGIGPAAHSYNGNTRQWNVSNISKYISCIETKTPPFEVEELSEIDLYNEEIIKRLRTSEGINIAQFTSRFAEKWVEKLHHSIAPLVEQGAISLIDNRYFIPEDKLLVSDSIMVNLIENN